MIRKCIQAIGALLFFILIAGIGIGTVWMPTTTTFEKRSLAAMPKRPLRLDEMSAWPKAWESWWSDAGYQRQAFISWHNRLRAAAGISPQTNVVVGKDGWLFFSGAEVLTDYRNAKLYRPDEIERWQRYLRHRDQDAKSKGAVYYLVIPPNKHTVYAEYLPDYIRPLTPISRLDQIIAAMQGSGVRIIDLRPALLEAKQYRQAYHKGDTHWNLWGANYAQYEILRSLQQDFSLIKPTLYSSEQFIDADMKAFNDADMRYYYGLYYMFGAADRLSELQPLLTALDRRCVKDAPLALEPWKHVEKKVRNRVFVASQCDQGHYRALIFRDSFAELLKPFLSSAFSYAAYIRVNRPMTLHYWNYFMDEVQPDIVLDEMIARHLRYVPKPGTDYPAAEGEAIDASSDEAYYEFD
ncbi:MAG TPA: hypothetical protein VIM96_09680 [Pseudomonadales bacterium]|jgi:hypothetical protein